MEIDWAQKPGNVITIYVAKKDLRLFGRSLETQRGTDFMSV